ncbi:unnamed protein product [Protopolystoma xenopodis]|uniref:Uncharacterized protein n=1 Tax=Protopolystoma xenopodis TaxID=117903 RepID=A0A448XRQ0_9PLAT|nr:unnamed protein product [Protopolystoma xenopodis]
MTPNEQFKEISHLVIPRAELSGRVITKEAFGHCIIGCPQCITGAKYDRNLLHFNTCLVVRPRAAPYLDDVTGGWHLWPSSSPDSSNCIGGGGCEIVSALRPPILAAYETLARKLNVYLAAEELEHGLLTRDTVQVTSGEQTQFSKGEVQTESGGRIKVARPGLSFFDQIWTDLKETGLSILSIRGSRSLYLKVRLKI